jgi:hypothetical protein
MGPKGQSGLHRGKCGYEKGPASREFSISEFDPSKLFAAALVDQARKHRKRPPEEERKIQEQRRRERLKLVRFLED